MGMIDVTIENERDEELISSGLHSFWGNKIWKSILEIMMSGCEVFHGSRDAATAALQAASHSQQDDHDQRCQHNRV